MKRSGRIITSTAAILIVVSAGFATGDILPLKALGLGTAIAVLVDSTIVRAHSTRPDARNIPPRLVGPRWMRPAQGV